MYPLIPAAVYLLCFATSSACAFLLFRAFTRSGARLLFWSMLCFLLLAGNNLIVIIDLFVVPGNDLSIVRLVFSLAAVSVLLFGFIWDLESE